MVDVWVPQEPGRSLVFRCEANGAGAVQQVVQAGDTRCGVARSERSTSTTVRCLAKDTDGIREVGVSHSTDEAGERLPSGAGGGKGKPGQGARGGTDGRNTESTNHLNTTT